MLVDESIEEKSWCFFLVPINTHKPTLACLTQQLPLVSVCEWICPNNVLSETILGQYSFLHKYNGKHHTSYLMAGLPYRISLFPLCDASTHTSTPEARKWVPHLNRNPISSAPWL